MAASEIDLTMIRGDTVVFQATFTDDLNAPVDDPGATYRMTGKNQLADPDSSEVFTVTASQTGPGVADLIVQPSMTRPLPPVPTTLLYDVQVTETSGRITTIQFGTLTVIPDVSITTP